MALLDELPDNLPKSTEKAAQERFVNTIVSEIL